MKTTMVRYRVKPERVAENEALIQAVFDELHAMDASGFHYSSFRMEDG